MIRFELLTKENMTEHSLDDFDRTQQVHQVYRKTSHEYELTKEEWIMDWSPEKKRDVAKTLFSQDYVTVGAIENSNIIGFASIKKEINEESIILDMIQVSRSNRRQGIGKKLFEQAKELARKAGARQLYISAFSSEDTIAFYKSMGCIITDNPIMELAIEEPYDLQMVCAIN
jgi:N-acetylglutamate synthase-like GNAT family acetyltransferase